MAFIDLDDSGDEIVNITMQVGPKQANRKDDVLAVQRMLQIIFLSVKNPKLQTKANLAMLFPGVFDNNTALMIHDFQLKFLRRPKPEGFIKRAAPGKNKFRFTIVRINLQLNLTLAALNSGFRDSVAFLRADPLLAPSLISPAATP